MPDLRHKQLAQITLVALLLFGCLLVLLPFIPAILFAAVLCVTTWPIFLRIRRRFGQRTGLAAMTMTLLLMLVVVLPLAGLSISLADGITAAVDRAQSMAVDTQINPPAWVAKVPFVGEELEQYWHKVADSRAELNKLLAQLAEPARKVVVKAGRVVGEGMLQLLLVLLIAFFFYRDGTELAKSLQDSAVGLAGELGEQMLGLARNTVTGVMVGIVGTAVAQAVVALIGFLIAGVPAAVLLAAGTFFLSMVPIGPPLLWGGAAWWLYDQGQSGWAIFMLIWGALVVSSVDNFVKPMLISRSAALPILLIGLGVFGGILAFGFIGIFLGPTLLALALALYQHWTEHKAKIALTEALSES